MGTVPLKVLIVDDEPEIRLVLKKVLERIPGFEWSGEAGDGAVALGLAVSLHPEIVFMDVEMPGISGVDCARSIAAVYPDTYFIFATAHEEYMADAFDLYAADYLLKPFKIERIEQTLIRIGELFRQHANDRRLTQESRVDKGLDKLLIRNKESLSLIDIKDIILIQREERSTVIYTADNRFITSESLSELEERLDQTAFLRSHKSYIINLAMIQKIYPYGRWTYLVKLKYTDKDALITAERFQELEKFFEIKG